MYKEYIMTERGIYSRSLNKYIIGAQLVELLNKYEDMVCDCPKSEVIK